MSAAESVAAVERPSNAPEACVGPASAEAGKASACAGCPNQSACASGAGRQEDPAVDQVVERLRDVKHKILVLSGKGGVGKSTVAAQLAWTLASQGYQVGLLDIDICGPSAPRMLGVEGHEVRKSNFGWSPVYASENLSVMSVAFMLGGRNEAIIWRGPRKNGLIKQFLTDVEWGSLDFLVVDAPPGTSDEHITIAQYLTKAGVDGAVIVTTPQEMALLDVRKEITFAHKVGVPVLGVVENMAGFICPSCRAPADIFPAITGGARAMSAEMQAPFLGALPLDPLLLQSCEEGKCYVEAHPTAPAVQPLKQLVQALLSSTPALKATMEAHQAEQMADAEAAPDATGSAAAAAAAPAAAAATAPRGVLSAWLQRWSARDAAGLAALFRAENGSFVSAAGEASVGAQAIASSLALVFSQSGAQGTGELSAAAVDEQRLGDEVALLRATLQPVAQAQASAQSAPLLLTLVVQRVPAAPLGWLIASAVASSTKQ